MTGTEVLQVIVQSIVIWVFISVAICSCIVIAKRRDAAYYKEYIKSHPKLLFEEYGNPRLLAERMTHILTADNQVKICITDGDNPVMYLKGDISKESCEFYIRFMKTHCDITLEEIYRFAEEFGVSIDYLLGRTDRETL